MAKVSVVLDTETETMEVSIDGTAVANVRGVMFDNYNDEAHCEIATGGIDEKTGMRWYSRMMASKAGVITKPDLQKAIGEYLQR